LVQPENIVAVEGRTQLEAGYSRSVSVYISRIYNPPYYVREEEEVFLDVRTLFLLDVDSKKISRELFIDEI